MGVVVRPAVVSDVRAVETVRVTGWKAAYRGLLPDQVLDDLVVDEERVARWAARLEEGSNDLTVAEADGRVVGWASAGACRDEDLPGARELWGLYVLPEWWGTGTAAALVAAARPLDVVWVLEGNARALAFYERQGFRLDGTTKPVDWLPAPHPTELRLRLG